MTHPTDAIPVLTIKGNSLDDGPGIRSVVFFKGCPLSCAWCHNPESWKASAEIAFDAKRCVDCGQCRDVCPEKALSKSNRYYVDRNRCTLCFACSDICPSQALEQVGHPMTVDDILAKILPDQPFFAASGGGVTLSGGEATLYMAFVARLLMALKARAIHTLLETCGSFDLERFMALVYPHLDAIYFDIKIMDSADHRKYCGLPNDRILENFRQLREASRRDGKPLLPRTPLVPGITDTPENIGAIADFLKRLGVAEAALLAYNPLWHEKYGKLGLDDPYKENKALTAFPDGAAVRRCKAIFSCAGIVLHE
ncbi:MAG: glycyl-radical enzyme activating protein [Desulfobacterales bacterium]|nr:glycyl-radical enzyme activating protein [Desulfobacterales bacterium]